MLITGTGVHSSPHSSSTNVTSTNKVKNDKAAALIALKQSLRSGRNSSATRNLLNRPFLRPMRSLQPKARSSVRLMSTPVRLITRIEQQIMMTKLTRKMATQVQATTWPRRRGVMSYSTPYTAKGI